MQPASADPSKIMQVGMGFWASKVLLSAVKFGLFSLLAGGKKLSATEIKSQLQLNTTDRHIWDWLDALTTLGFLNREGLKSEATYANTTVTEVFLDIKKPAYIGGLLQMANSRLYKIWGTLEEALKTGEPQNEIKDNMIGEGFDVLYETKEKMQEFIDAMSGIQTGNFMVLAQKFDFGKYKTLADIGGADSWLSIIVCRQYPGLKCTSFDLPQVKEAADKKVSQFNLQERITNVSGNFFKDDFPSADIITMGNILHGMNEESKQETINKVYNSLPAGGVFIAIENLIDENRNQNLFGMLMSLNMLLENGEAFDYTPSDFTTWAKKAGFQKTEFIPLTGPASAAIAYK